MAYLEIETREGSRTVRLDRERLSIGRLSYNDVVLPYAQVSRQHAELRCIQGQWWIADLHSTNGLQMDSMRIQEHALRPGDRIVL
ncbi:MAG TPA: FHA domain-containing protein, partial [Ktedonobacterales bacterium]